MKHASWDVGEEARVQLLVQLGVTSYHDVHHLHEVTEHFPLVQVFSFGGLSSLEEKCHSMSASLNEVSVWVLQSTKDCLAHVLQHVEQ